MLLCIEQSFYWPRLHRCCHSICTCLRSRGAEKAAGQVHYQLSLPLHPLSAADENEINIAAHHSVVVWVQKLVEKGSLACVHCANRSSGSSSSQLGNLLNTFSTFYLPPKTLPKRPVDVGLAEWLDELFEHKSTGHYFICPEVDYFTFSEREHQSRSAVVQSSRAPCTRACCLHLCLMSGAAAATGRPNSCKMERISIIITTTSI